ncbi:MAG: putative glycoside hydrolase [Lachnospiraceae bacterium]|nr:putative glycoside hydrolase [Lachnospiraceae bacterium]
MNRREWKKSRLSGQQIRKRKILTITLIAAGALLASAAIIVLLVTGIPGGNGPVFGLFEKTAETVDEDHTGSAVTQAGELSGKGESVKPKVAAEKEAEEAAAKEAEAAEESAFDREAWLDSHVKVRGIYVTGPVAGSSRFEEILDVIDQTDINAVVLDIKNDEGVVSFKMTSGTPADIGACVGYIRDIDSVLSELKKRDVYVIGRIACFKDPILAEAIPELALLSDDGTPVTDKEGLAWVNPCSEDTWEYMIELAEYGADLGFDEIQFDYVRFPVGDEAANADYGTEINDTDKHTYIEGFLRKASERIHAKGIPVSADLFGTVIGNEIDVTMVGQDYAELARCVDAICPMVYPSHYGNGVYGFSVPDARPYDTVYAALSDSVEVLSEVPGTERAVVRAWLQAFTATWVTGHITYGADEIREQIRAVEDAGYDEWILWNARNNYVL